MNTNYFGPRDFTAQARATLAPLVVEGFDTNKEYWCFRGLTAKVVAQLLEQLPADSSTGRHNDAPSFGSFVEAASVHEGILLEGYVVGPTRKDECVNLTGMLIPVETNVAEAIKVLEELDTNIPPDESDWNTFEGNLYWRVWWD